MRKLTIKVGPGIASSYKLPGQYTKARANAQQVAQTLGLNPTPRPVPRPSLVIYYIGENTRNRLPMFMRVRGRARFLLTHASSERAGEARLLRVLQRPGCYSRFF
jgi:hypothetical protein